MRYETARQILAEALHSYTEKYSVHEEPEIYRNLPWLRPPGQTSSPKDAPNPLDIRPYDPDAPDREFEEWIDKPANHPNAPWNFDGRGQRKPPLPAYSPERYKNEWRNRRIQMRNFIRGGRFNPLRDTEENPDPYRISVNEVQDSWNLPGHPDYTGPWMIPMKAPGPRPPRPQRETDPDFVGPPSKPRFQRWEDMSPYDRNRLRSRELWRRTFPDSQAPGWSRPPRYPPQVDPPTPKPPLAPPLIRKPARLTNPGGNPNWSPLGPFVHRGRYSLDEGKVKTLNKSKKRAFLASKGTAMRPSAFVNPAAHTAALIASAREKMK